MVEEILANLLSAGEYRELVGFVDCPLIKREITMLIGPYTRLMNGKEKVNTRRIKRELKFRKNLTKYNNRMQRLGPRLVK